MKRKKNINRICHLSGRSCLNFSSRFNISIGEDMSVRTSSVRVIAASEIVFAFSSSSVGMVSGVRKGELSEVLVGVR